MAHNHKQHTHVIETVNHGRYTLKIVETSDYRGRRYSIIKRWFDGGWTQKKIRSPYCLDDAKKQLQDILEGRDHI